MTSQLKLGLFLALAVFASTSVAFAEPTKLAIAPVEHGKKLDKDAASILYSSLCEASMDGRSGSVVLIPEGTVRKATRKLKGQMDDANAVKLGEKLGAELVLVSSVRKLGDSLRISVKLVAVDDGNVIGVASGKGGNVSLLEAQIHSVVHKAFGTTFPGGTSGPAPAPSTTSPTSPHPSQFQGFGDVRISAVGSRAHRPEEGQLAVEADVYINGRLVGKTPFEDGLPPGGYLFEIKAHKQVAQKELLVVKGELAEFAVTFDIPMTDEEKAEKKKKRRAATVAAHAAREALWKKELTAWEKENEAVGKKRRPLIGAGMPLLIIGTGLLITGIAFEVGAKKEDRKYKDHKSVWLNSVDPEVIATAKSNMDAAAETRDLNNGLGIASLVVGGVSAVTGIILLVAAPKRPEKPTRSRTLGANRGPDLALVPALGHNGGSLTLNINF